MQDQPDLPMGNQFADSLPQEAVNEAYRGITKALVEYWKESRKEEKNYDASKNQTGA